MSLAPVGTASLPGVSSSQRSIAHLGFPFPTVRKEDRRPHLSRAANDLQTDFLTAGFGDLVVAVIATGNGQAIAVRGHFPEGKANNVSDILLRAKGRTQLPIRAFVCRNDNTVVASDR